MKKKRYFTNFEIGLWGASVLCILLSYIFFEQNGLMALIASLLGVTSLIFNAKGNPFGQLLMIIFGVLYGIISYGYAYYGEMITYLGMTAPMALVALISWLKNPYKGNKAEVAVNRLCGKEIGFMFALSAVVTLGLFCY